MPLEPNKRTFEAGDKPFWEGQQHPDCIFKFFVGKKLNSPWNIRSVEFGIPVDWVQRVQSDTYNPFFSIEVRSEEFALALSSITLSGPKGADWHDAFRR